MGQIKPHQRRLSISMAIMFAVQVFAVTFCLSNQASATPAAQTTMAMPCPAGMDAPAQNKAPCTYCDLPDTNTSAVGFGSLSIDLTLLAILPDTSAPTSIEANAHVYNIAQAQAPPGSASLIYKTSLRIRL
ncbi:MAG: hypothetical protein ACE5DY_03895 [Mariprofundaceae bacterium]